MERLADRNADGNYFYPKCFEKCDGLGTSRKCDNCEITTSICEKLGKYEDNTVYAWGNGATSWSARESYDIFAWKMAKMAESEEKND